MKTLIHRYQTTSILGALVILTPFLGVPNSLRTFILVVLGLSIIVFGSTSKHRLLAEKKEEIPARPPNLPAPNTALREETLS
jgi:hypothetical protein